MNIVYRAYKRQHVLLSFIGLLIVIALVLVACGDSTPNASSSSATPDASSSATPTATPSIAYQMASLDTSGNPDSATVAKYQKVLTSLHNKTGDSEQAISDGTIKGQQLLRDKGKDATLFDLMNGVDTSITSKSEHINYAEALAALITIMENQ
jgi:hypothetical protein